MPFYSQLEIKEVERDKVKKLRTTKGIQRLREALLAQFSAKHTKSVKIATWNLREFGAGKYAGRDFECLYYIAEIISHFDIIALQEIRSDMREFNALRKILGPDWSFIASDVTDGSAGNGERMIFVYNRKTTFFRNVAGELTLDDGEKIRAAFGERIKLENGFELKLANSAASLDGTYDASLKSAGDKKKLAADLEVPIPDGSQLTLPSGVKLVLVKNTVVESPGRGKATITLPNKIEGEQYRLRFLEDSLDDSFKQFARTPYLISFQSGWLKINLCTVHIYYGNASDDDKLEQRRSEIEQLTKALAKKAASEYSLDGESFLGVLGDFNIIGKGHPTMEALESNDFIIPDQLKSIPGSNVARDKAYDQIAFWKPKRVKEYAKLDILAGNTFDYFEHVFRLDQEGEYRNEAPQNGLKDTGTFNTWRTYKMSDHLPMWVELRSDFSDEYLAKIIKSEVS
ncbi:Endonuclease/Exonuclease/phosphatase family protein [Spirosomataceae bacterium TFI 002]|nr:Endonuclease/Exonuclease/phosphatase family protein [Spirosomataceae bacterium TFI 002]